MAAPPPPPPEWAPQQEGVTQIVQLLVDYRQPGANQTQMMQRLQQCAQIPDFNNYLAFILTQGEGAQDEIRQTAGLLLKNNLKTGWTSMRPEFRGYIQRALLPGLGHASRFLRQTVGTAVSIIARAAGPTEWPDVYPALVQCIESGNEHLVDGGLDAIYKVCEELNGRLDGPVAGMPEGSPAGLLIPRLLQLMAHPTPGVRRSALGAINLMVPSWPSSHGAAMDTYLQGLFALAHDADNGVRKHVSAGIVGLLYRAPEKLSPNMREVITFMIERTNDGDEEVALESCEFWAAFCEADLESDTVDVLREFTPKLIPMLLTNMAYAEDDEEVIAVEDDEANQGREDTDKDIKPTFRGQKDKGGGGGGGGEEGTSGDGDEDDEYNDDEDDEDPSQWNLRKSSANGLDLMSTIFGDELLSMILPIVEQRLRDPNWRLRESAILAVGAISEGCSTGLAQFLPQLVEFLLPSLDDQRPMVRSITCWTLSRFSRWVVQMAFAPGPGGAPSPTAAQGVDFMNKILAGLLKRVLDHNKHVQAAACGALATLEGEAREDIKPWLGPIITTLSQAMSMYQRKNMRCAFDAVATLAENAGDAIRTQEVAAALLPPLLQRWEAGGDSQPDLYQLLECVTSVTMGVGLGAQDYAAPMFARALGLTRQQLSLREVAAQGAADVPYEADHVICAIDLLSGIADGMGPGVEALIAGHAEALREVIVAACSDPHSPGVRRSAFALVGDVAKSGCAQHIHACLSSIMQCAAANLRPNMVQAYNMSVCNNACWSTGEIAAAVPANVVAPYVPALAEAFVNILKMTMIQRSLGENAAIALGRFAIKCPEQLSGGFAEIVSPWCGALRRLRDGVEKEQAFAGLVRLVQANPSGGVPGLVPMMNAIASWQTVRDRELHANLMSVMSGYEQHIGPEQWQALCGQLGAAVQRKLANFVNIVQPRA